MGLEWTNILPVLLLNLLPLPQLDCMLQLFRGLLQLLSPSVLGEKLIAEGGVDPF